MHKAWFKLCGLLLVIVLLANMMPLQVFAEQLNTEDMDLSAPNTDLAEKETVSGKIVEEITDKRTEFTKQFLMDNGLFIAAVYNEAVHFEKDGKWTEIDNTLKAQQNGTYTNTDGIWNVSFPNQLTKANRISVTKDTYTLSFGMAGELRTGGNLEIMSGEAPLAPATIPGESIAVEETTAAVEFIEETIALEETTVATETSEETTTAEETTPETLTSEDVLAPSELIEGNIAETFAVTQAQATTAQLEAVDIAAVKAEAEHPEMVADKLSSGLMYSNVYGTTDIRYQLNSNKIKESIILESYSSTLRGYRYTLEVGDLNPALQEDGSIHFYDAENKEIVMVMEAPFLVDAAYKYSYDVHVQLTGSGSTYTLTYLLPTSWLASADRAWPVVLDSVISASLAASNIQDQTVTARTTYSYTRGINECGYGQVDGIQRFFLKYNKIPELTSSDVVVYAQITMHKFVSGTTATVQVHKVLGDWDSRTITWANKPAYDTTIEDYQIAQAEAAYVWDITDIVRSWYETANYGMMFRVNDAVENGTTNNWKQFYSSNYSDYPFHMPALQIVFRNNNGLESYWDYTTSSAGRAGTGYVNNFTGNLIWTRGDIGFGGNRMPVSISHVYNANDALSIADSNNSNDTAGNAFGLGNGWRTNYNQLVYKWSENSNYYVWEDSDGTDHYFKYDTGVTYKDEDGLELTLKTSGSGESMTYTITDKNGNTSYFDSSGRLIKLENNQATKSSIQITYSGTTKRITQITDGIGRKYNFTYNASDLLTRISYVGTGATELSYVSFGYSDSNLTSVTDKDGKVSTYGYGTNNLLTSATDIDGYKLAYTYGTIATGKPARVKTVTESDGSTAGGKLTFAYQHNQTTITDRNGNKQILQFNNMGNTICVQDGEGRAQYAQFAKNDADSTGKANQLKVASKLQYTVGNRVIDGSIENGYPWSASGTTATSSASTVTAYIGNKSLKVVNSTAGSLAGIHSSALSVPAGRSYTFSCYIQPTSADVQLIAKVNGQAVAASETLNTGNTWTRMQVSYTNNTDDTQMVECHIVTDDAGTFYLDAAQRELAATASRYNLVSNGDFHSVGNPPYGWTKSSGCTSADVAATLSASAAPQLDSNVFKLTGSPTTAKNVVIPVVINGVKDDCYVFGGWAKGNSVPLIKHGENTSEFAIQMRFDYTDGSNSGFLTAQFNPDSNEWQYVSGVAVAQKAYNRILIRIVYNYNMNTAYFDGIQLFKEQFGTSYTYDGDGNVTSVVDLQNKTTSYEYDTKNNLTKILQDNKAKMTYTYDDYHNVKTATSEEGLVYNFTYDTWGNNTAVSIGSGATKITSSAVYSSDGNRLESTTDALGKTTSYSYNANTNVLEWVKYPEDTDTTKTTYTYDSMYRMATAAVTTDTGLNLSAAYTYENDLLTSIQTASTTYGFTYGNFALRSSVKVGEQNLATYSYTQDGNNYLSSLDYGNGDKVQYEYDRQGTVTKQTYEDGDTVTYRYDNSGALATVEDSATGRKTTYYYDLTDRMVKYVETGTDYYHSVGYEYDTLNNLTTLVENVNGTEYTTSYTYDDDNRVASVTSNGTTVVYTYDAYGRITTQVTKRGETTVLTETYTYVAPTSTTTSSQIATYKTETANYSVTYTYTYDDNGNILSVSDGTNTTSYVYDSANQLIRENNQSQTYTYTWSYDSAGNIQDYKTYNYTTDDISTATLRATDGYTYGDENWGDLLTAFDGNAITYDEIGNPLSDATRTFTWEHGREMATQTKNGVEWEYTYDANGMRTSRTSGTKTYDYVYSGDKLVQMTVKDTTANTTQLLEFAYDAAGQPLTMTLDGTVYYYLLNIQGDVMGLVDGSGNLLAAFSYTAYGKAYSVNNVSSMGTTLASANPLTYRGYVLDMGTGIYYLQSRYYDPNMGRFLNADVYTSTGQGILGCNMFAYSLDNPVMLVDPSGYCSYLGSIHAPKMDCGRYNCPDSASYCPDAIDVTEELNSAMIKHSLKLKNIADVYGPGAFMYFALKSKKGSEWDLKDEGGWDLDPTKVYRYGDQALREDDIGNIHYGFVGRTLTNLDTLLFVAGFVQICDGSSDWSYWRTNFDEPRDQWAITIGYNLWEDGLRS